MNPTPVRIKYKTLASLIVLINITSINYCYLVFISGVTHDTLNSTVNIVFTMSLLLVPLALYLSHVAPTQQYFLFSSISQDKNTYYPQVSTTCGLRYCVFNVSQSVKRQFYIFKLSTNHHSTYFKAKLRRMQVPTYLYIIQTQSPQNLVAVLSINDAFGTFHFWAVLLHFLGWKNVNLDQVPKHLERN